MSVDALVMPIHHSGLARVEKGCGWRNGMGAYRLEISDTLSRHLTLLCAEEALLLEYEAGTDQETAGNSEDNADNLERRYERNTERENEAKVP